MKVVWFTFKAWLVSPSRSRESVGLVVLLAIPVVMALTPISWLEDDSHTLCVWHNITGEDCYGCGLMRAFFSVMHLDFTEAWGYNRLVLLAFPVITFLWARALLRTLRVFVFA